MLAIVHSVLLAYAARRDDTPRVKVEGGGTCIGTLQPLLMEAQNRKADVHIYTAAITVIVSRNLQATMLVRLFLVNKLYRSGGFMDNPPRNDFPHHLAMNLPTTAEDGHAGRDPILRVVGRTVGRRPEKEGGSLHEMRKPGLAPEVPGTGPLCDGWCAQLDETLSSQVAPHSSVIRHEHTSCTYKWETGKLA